jgi:glycosyltransferase involved in cell wall biosynthesis
MNFKNKIIMNKPVVSVFILTYNQEQFIAQTLDSILMQKTNFSFKLVIGEDCSTDSTRTICENYAAKYGDRIKLLPALEKNIGLINNYMRTIAECNGKYIAICDGDDYWIDDYKLQKQVDFLEQNPDYSIVYTALQRLFPNGEIKEYNYHLNKRVLNFDDLIFDNFMHSVTVVFKNVLNEKNRLPQWILKFPFGDWQTYLWTIKDGGKIHFLKDVTASYRMDIGLSSVYMKKNSAFLKRLISLLEEVYQDEHFYNKKEIIAKSIFNKKRNLMTSLNREKSYFKGLLLFFVLLLKTDGKIKLSKLYLYSIYKSIQYKETKN